jgi:glycosyltransferase involved in cell wall biosynthesis
MEQMQDNDDPLISIVITNYNYGKYLSQAITSAIGQTYRNTEIILIDDASTDDSGSVFSQFADRLDVVEHDTNMGIVFTRNEALRISHGDFLCFLDADDYWDADYLEKMCAVAIEYDADVVYPNWRLFGDKNVVTDFPEFSSRLLQLQKINCTAESLIRLARVKEFQFRSEKIAEDWDFFIRLSLAGLRFKRAKDCYVNYRIKSDSRGEVVSEAERVRDYMAILEGIRADYGDAVIDSAELPLARLDERNADIAVLESELEDSRALSAERMEAIDSLRGIVGRYEEELAQLRDSHSYRIGLALTAPLRALRRRASRHGATLK